MISLRLILALSLFSTFIARAEEVEWLFTYDADALPEASLPAWKFDGEDAKPDASIVTDQGSNVLRQNLQPGYMAGWRITGGPNFPLKEACTVEIRARILGSKGYVLGAEVRNYWVGGVRFRIASGGVEIITTNDRKAVSHLIDDEFHVYRLTVEGAVAKLYMDGAKEPLVEIQGSGGDGIWIAFGDVGHLRGSGEVDYDYVRWTTDGAFAP